MISCDLHTPATEKIDPYGSKRTPLADAFDQLDFEYVSGVAQKAMRAVTEQRVPPTPQNFHVWFKYALGTPVELKRTIDILVANKRKFDPATNRDLYTTYVGSKGTDDAAAHQVSQQLHGVLASAQQFLNAAIADNRTHIEAISEVADRSEAGVDPRVLVETLMNELRKAATRATKLETQFAEKSRELDIIRESLSKSEERARTDTLTGLPNRRALEEFFRTAQTTAMEQGQPLSALLIDIDHFKKFNDNFGHGVGDQVLRLVAKALRERVRDSDLAARYGGEELIAVLPGADLAACTATAERIRRGIAEGRITRRSSGEELPGITVSIGVGQFQLGESMEEMIDRCDRALYQAKKRGRNLVVTENEIEPGRAVG
jgi:diguanylate cyclase